MSSSIATATAATTSLDHSKESATTALYRAAIGPVNADYYLPIFTRFEATNRAGVSWNWAASLYTLNWMAFRGLWLAALVYAATMGGMAILVFQFPDAVEVRVLLVLGVLSLVVPGVIGNALFHAESRKKMAHALSVSSTLAQACAMLNRQAGSRRRFIWLALLNVALAGAAVGGLSDIFRSRDTAAGGQKNGRRTQAGWRPCHRPHPETGACGLRNTNGPSGVIARIDAAIRCSVIGACRNATTREPRLRPHRINAKSFNHCASGDTTLLYQCGFVCQGHERAQSARQIAGCGSGRIYTGIEHPQRQTHPGACGTA